MSHLRPVLLLLLTSLFFLPALHGAIDFEYCDKFGNDYANLKSINITPLRDDPGYNIYVYGHATKTITAGTVVYLTYKLGEDSGVLNTYKICEVSMCNNESEIEAGTTFVMKLRNDRYVPLKKETKYYVSFRQENPEKTILCVEFKLPTPTPTLVSA